MKVEKKIVALCVFALVIGVAAILPTVYFMGRPTGVNIPSKPWFNVDMLYADAISDAFSGRYGGTVNVVANFTLTSEALNLHGADAKIEVFNFHVYSDQTSVANITYCLSQTGTMTYLSESDTFIETVRELGDGCYVFADGTKFDIKDAIGYSEEVGSGQILLITLVPNPAFDQWGNRSDVFSATTISKVVGNVTALLSPDKGELSAQALINLRSAQTLYIDVTRVMTITYQHHTNHNSAGSSIVTTLASSEVLSHIELTKTDFGFTYGTAPDLTSNNWIIAPSIAPIEINYITKVINVATGVVVDDQ